VVEARRRDLVDSQRREHAGFGESPEEKQVGAADNSWRHVPLGSGASTEWSKRNLLIEPDSFLIIVGYCLGLWLLFQ
jgi:hypothetical protein